MTKMSKEQLFKEQLKRIYECTGTRTQKELAEALGVQQSTISSMQKKQNIPDSWLVTLMKKFSVNINWIENAVEPIYISLDSDIIIDLQKQQENNISKSLHEPTSLNAFDSYNQSAAKRVAVYSSYYTGEMNENNERVFDFEKYITLPEILFTKNLMVFSYKNKNMEPSILKNSIIGIDLNFKDLTNGEIMAFCIPQQGISLYRVYHSTTSNEVNMLDLKPDNNTFPLLTKSLDVIRSYFLGKVNWTLNVF